MKFDWTEFTEIDFADYCAKVENDMIDPDGYIGCVRVGNLCFDLMVRINENDELYLAYDLYVGGVDSGYGYSDVAKAKDIYDDIPNDWEKTPNYPYDYAEGGNFENTMISMTYEEFQKYAEEKFELFIKIWPYEAASLVDKANEPLNIW